MLSEVSIYDLGAKLWNNTRLRISIIATIIMSFAAHAYAYFNATIGHDRITFFMSPVYNSAARAKWMAQFVDMLTAFTYVPWFFGILTIIFFSVSIYLIVEILDIKRGLSIVLVAGLCITDFAVLGAHFYWPQEIIAALPMACLSVWFWTKREWSLVIRIMGEAILVGCSLATYGAYTSVAPTLVLMASVTELIHGTDWKEVLKKGSEYIVAFLSGLVFYYAIQRCFLYIQNIELYNYMGENKLVEGVSVKEIFELIQLAYEKTLKYYLGYYKGFVEAMPPIVARCILIIGIFLFVYVVVKNWKNVKPLETKILIILLLLAAPLSVGLIYVMSFGNVHFLMTFTFVLFYVYLIKLAEDAYEIMPKKYKGKSFRIIPILLIVAVMFWTGRSTLICNMAYTRIENLYTTSTSIATRLLDRIESCTGFEGHETIVFVGDLSKSEYFLGDQNENKEYLNYFINMGPVTKNAVHGFSYEGLVDGFMKNVLGTKLSIEHYDSTYYTSDKNEIIGKMPIFPADGSVTKIEDTVVVKLND